MSSPVPVVGLLMGSDSDWPVVQQTAQTLDAFGVAYEVRVISAHRTPDLAHDYACGAAARGLQVLIAAAGGAAHLAGALAANTNLPVIGVPLATGTLGGFDALLATVQMPAGVPVATVAIGQPGATNAALLAVQILALSRPDVAARLAAHKTHLRDKAAQADARVQTESRK